MNAFLSFCWALSYIFAYVSFIYFGWRWSAEVRTWEAMAFWLLLTAVLGVIGLVIFKRSITVLGG